MEEQRPPGTIDSPEITSPSAGCSTDDSHDEVGSASSEALYSEEKRPPLAQRLAEAFREGVASSSRTDYVKRPEIRVPPAERTRRQETDAGAVLGRAVQEGGAAAAAVGDKAAVVLDHVVQLAKKAPGAMQKYAQAFREGAASVKSREGAEREARPPRPAGEIRSPFAGKAILDRLLHSKTSAGGMLRDAIAAIKPSPARGAWRKIRMSKKRIHELYTEIGCEVADAWANGPVETEKVTGLLDELRKNEQEIQERMAQIAEAEAAKKAEAARKAEPARSQPAEEEVVPGPAPMPAPEHKEEASAGPGPVAFEEAVTIEVSPEAVPAPEHTQEAEAVPPEEASAGPGPVAFEEAVTIEMSPAVQPAPEHTQEAEAVPSEEASAGPEQAVPEESAAIEMSPAAEPAPEHMGDAEAAPHKEASTGADQAPSGEPARYRRKGKMNGERQR